VLAARSCQPYHGASCTSSEIGPRCMHGYWLSCMRVMALFRATSQCISFFLWLGMFWRAKLPTVRRCWDFGSQTSSMTSIDSSKNCWRSCDAGKSETSVKNSALIFVFVACVNEHLLASLFNFNYVWQFDSAGRWVVANCREVADGRQARPDSRGPYSRPSDNPNNSTQDWHQAACNLMCSWSWVCCMSVLIHSLLGK